MISLGHLVMTAGVSGWANENPSRMKGISNCIRRHQNGDWGDVCEEDREANNQAVEDGSRLLSSYSVDGEKLWVITEWDRSVTTVLFPSEY